MSEDSFAEVRLENTLSNTGYFLDPRVNHSQKQAYSWELDDSVDKEKLIVNLNYLILITTSYVIIMFIYNWGNWGS